MCRVGFAGLALAGLASRAHAAHPRPRRGVGPEPALVGGGARPHACVMFAVSEEDAAAIRAAFEQGGEFAAAVELRRRFPLIKDNAEARVHARAIAGWKPLVVPLRPVTRLGTGTRKAMWHVIYEDQNGRVESRAARSRDLAIHMACELLRQACVVRRAIGSDGAIIERAELEAYYDEGRFPGLR